MSARHQLEHRRNRWREAPRKQSRRAYPANIFARVGGMSRELGRAEAAAKMQKALGHLPDARQWAAEFRLNSRVDPETGRRVRVRDYSSAGRRGSRR